MPYRNTTVFILFITLFLTNCTIEKRLYRKGWHVEFQRKHAPIEEDVVNERSRSAMVTATSGLEPTSILKDEIREQMSATDSVSINKSETSNTLVNTSKRITENNPDKLSIQSKSPEKINKKQKRPYNQHDKMIIVTVLSVLLLFFLLMIILLLFGLAAPESIASSVVFVFLLISMVPIALGLFIALFVIMFSRTAEQKQSEAQKKKKLEDMTPEEQEAYLLENPSKGSNKKSGNITAALIAVAIVLLAIFVLSDK